MWGKRKQRDRYEKNERKKNGLCVRENENVREERSKKEKNFCIRE